VFAIEFAVRPAAYVSGISIVVISIVNNAVFITLACRLLIAISFAYLPPNVGVSKGCTLLAQR
jgi:hypothetical protein